MTGLIIILTFVLLAVIIIQLGKVKELSKKIRGEEKVDQQDNDRSALAMLIFMIVFLIAGCTSAYMYKNQMLGYGPNEAASIHGVEIDNLFNITLFFTGIVFLITHILLFWYTYKYRQKKGRKALFFAHDTKLELIWTGIPSIVLVYLVVKGLVVWNDVMPDVGPDDKFIEIEATGYQFAWDLRYPGPDNKLGTRNFRLIEPGSNPLGQDWKDEKNIDDFMPSEIVLPVDEQVRVRITAKDVLHNFYLPHFRVKMDAIPGLPTYFIFTPTKTTQQYREQLREYPEWRVPADELDPKGPERWETFDYELACAELCGTGHWSMRRVVRVVSREEYDKWCSEQSSYFLSNIRNTNADPFKGELLGAEIKNRSVELTNQFNAALASEDTSDDIINLEHVFFNTGSANLKDISKHELSNIATILKSNKDIKIELGGHTDNTGDENANTELSKKRSDNVMNYLTNLGVIGERLTSVGYGQSKPVADNATVEGRQQNRRTEMRLITQ